MWDNLGRTVAEYAHLDKFDLHGADPRIVSENIDVAEKMRGKPVLMLSGHFANWEVMGIAAARFGLDGAIVYRPPNNPYVDRYIARRAGQEGLSPIKSASIMASGASSRCCAPARPSCFWRTRRPMKAWRRRFSAATP